MTLLNTDSNFVLVILVSDFSGKLKVKTKMQWTLFVKSTTNNVFTLDLNNNEPCIHSNYKSWGIKEYNIRTNYNRSVGEISNEKY